MRVNGKGTAAGGAGVRARVQSGKSQGERWGRNSTVGLRCDGARIREEDERQRLWLLRGARLQRTNACAGNWWHWR